MSTLATPETKLRDNRTTIFELVNFIGSIASITGISLLWLKGSINISPDVIVAAVLGVSFCFGLLLLEVLILRSFYRKFVFGRSSLFKTVFLSRQSSRFTGNNHFVLLLIKVIGSPEFKWLFRA